MITEKYRTLSDYDKKDRALIENGYKDFFKNKNYFNLIKDTMNIIEYVYDTYRIFLCNNADIIISNNDIVQDALFSCQIADIKVDNKNNLLAFVSSDFDLILIDFKAKKTYNSKEF